MQGAFEANRAWAAFAVTGVILGAAYLLWLYQRTMPGPDHQWQESAPSGSIFARWWCSLR